MLGREFIYHSLNINTAASLFYQCFSSIPPCSSGMALRRRDLSLSLGAVQVVSATCDLGSTVVAILHIIILTFKCPYSNGLNSLVENL